MELLTQLLQALRAQDFETLANPSIVSMLYFVLFVILFLENDLLPMAFLPGDSLLILVGALITKGAAGYPQAILLLTVVTSLGCQVSYIQRQWLGNIRIAQDWLPYLPAHRHQRAHRPFHKHGLSALLISRFITPVRAPLPTIAGLSGLSNACFQFFDQVSGLLQMLILTALSCMLGKTSIFLKYEDQLMSCLMLLPVVLLVFGLAGSLIVLWKEKYGNREQGMQIPRVSFRQLAWFGAVLLLVSTLLLAWSTVRQQGSTLAIRAVHQGTTMPDGSPIWHHLNTHGIPLKSITPKGDTLLVTFDSGDQSATAKAVLDRTLSHGYIIAQQDNNSQTIQWLTQLWGSSHHFR